MKKLLLIWLFVLGLTPVLKAQFTLVDTVRFWAGTTPYFYSYINNTSSSNVVVKWQVTASDFPTDWIPTLSICDNNICYANSASSSPLWNGTTGNTFTSAGYAPGPNGDFHMVNNFSGVTVGTHYLTVNIKDASSSFNANTTFIISHVATGVTTITKSNDDVILYPNPAINELNVIFNENAGVKTVAIYNIIGTVVSVYKVAGNSARLSVDNIPSGVYFIRLLNSQGNIVATRKFNKQ